MDLDLANAMPATRITVVAIDAIEMIAMSEPLNFDESEPTVGGTVAVVVVVMVVVVTVVVVIVVVVIVVVVVVVVAGQLF